MKTSDAGIFALALHEGIVPGPYRDSVGVWTYGIGHTLGAGAHHRKKAVDRPQGVKGAHRGEDIECVLRVRPAPGCRSCHER